MTEQPIPAPPILKLEKVIKTYHSGHQSLTVIRDISFAVPPGESVAIIGPSGSGKTTLLGICAGLDRPSGGEIELCGHRLDQLTEDQRAEVRNRKLGFVFQNFQLIPTLTALDNILIPLELRGDHKAREQALDWLAKVGLADRGHHYPVQLSGGEQQRIALARACVGNPEILFADEPTGNLDDETSQQIEDLLFETHARIGNTMILVTHARELAQRCDRVLRIRSGHLEEVIDHAQS